MFLEPQKIVPFVVLYAPILSDVLHDYFAAETTTQSFILQNSCLVPR